jgi:hypothetical protein
MECRVDYWDNVDLEDYGSDRSRRPKLQLALRVSWKSEFTPVATADLSESSVIYPLYIV